MTTTLAAVAPTLTDAHSVIGEPDYEIGVGICRTVYHRPGDFWAYKLASYGGQRGQNRTELDNYTRLRDSLPDDVRFPLMVELSETVIAVEYIPGEHPDRHCSADGYHQIGCDPDSDCWARKWHYIGDELGDIHRDNVKILDGVLYVLDLGFRP